MPKRETNLDYQKKKERARKRSKAESLQGRDIGDIPPVLNSKRKAAGSRSFKAFCESYFPEQFPLAWSDDHLRVIAKIEQSVNGGLFAVAMPRGSGKTTLCETAVIWAIVTGRHQFIFLIGATEPHAADMLKNIKSQLSHNDRLYQDFPEAIHAIRKLENEARRCQGQIHHGIPTLIEWKTDRVVMPTIPGSQASGAVIRVAGLTGSIRGAVHTRPDGNRVRPSLVILDDPQTDDSARSPSQCQTRESILAGAVLGLAGPGRRISGIMPCTVIRPDDMADRILNRDIHPQWNGERTKMVYSFPVNEALWEQYAKIRTESFKADKGLSLATEFYAQNREDMDAGARVAWEARYNEDEISAIQHAMNLKIQDEPAFFAEYQNEPMTDDEIGEDVLKIDEVISRINRRKRREIPDDAIKLTAFVDVQKTVLFYTVAAWAEGFTGYVVDYGVYPDQGQQYFSLRDVKRTLSNAAPGAGLEGFIYAGLETLTGAIANTVFERDDGTPAKVDRILIDANWGDSTDVVYRFCRQSEHVGVVIPAHGRYVGASSIPFDQYKKKRGDRVGFNWRLPSVSGRRAIRHVLFDTNFWKSFIASRWRTAIGDPGALTIFGRNPDHHRMFAEQCVAEYPVKTEGRGRVIDEWKLFPNRDNHFLDCVVGTAVGASMEGITISGEKPAARKRPKRSFADMQRAARR